MQGMRAMLTAACAALVLIPAGASAQEANRDHVTWVEHKQDSVLKEMEDRDDAAAKAATERTEEILAHEKEEAKARKKARRDLRFAVGEIERPEGPSSFTTVWHQPPTAQFLTGTCWSFSTTSFLESEAKRLGGVEVKLSEMWSAYWEYVEKAKGFVASRGETAYEEGSESNAVLRVMRGHGLMTRAAYPGVLAADGRFDHSQMIQKMQSFLAFCKEHGYWDEAYVVGGIRAILDETMGAPPETVEWQGRTLTPQQFMSEVCHLDPTDYVDVMSTLSKPFWTRAEYEVPDNWWHDASYVNVPLADWYAAVVKAIDAGYSLVIGGDVSEPGIWGEEDVAVVPSFDIPQAYIDQDARELRFYNHTSTDDHGIHLVGHTRLDGHDWFLIKDSGRSARRGSFKGYYMYRDDYVKLKMLTIMVHKDAVADLLARVKAAQ